MIILKNKIEFIYIFRYIYINYIIFIHFNSLKVLYLIVMRKKIKITKYYKFFILRSEFTYVNIRKQTYFYINLTP